ncbi:receptor-type tyrosine-protein phosphatase C [Neosynchiropus ocellatus]
MDMAGVCGVKILLLWLFFSCIANCSAVTQPTPGANNVTHPTAFVSISALDPDPSVLSFTDQPAGSFTVTAVKYGYELNISSIDNSSSFTINVRETHGEPYNTTYRHGVGVLPIKSLKPCTDYELSVFDDRFPERVCNLSGKLVKTIGMAEDQIRFNVRKCDTTHRCFETDWNITDQARNPGLNDTCTNMNTTFSSENCNGNFTVTNYIGVVFYPAEKVTFDKSQGFPATIKAQLPGANMCNFTEEYNCSGESGGLKSLSNLDPFTNYNCNAAIKDDRGPPLSLPDINFRIDCVPGNMTDIKLTFTKHNRIEITCKGPTSFFGEKKIYMANLSDGSQHLHQQNNSCALAFENLKYSTTYQLKLYTFNGKLSGHVQTRQITTLYNDKAIIGVLVFFIILILLALLFVSYKIYRLKRTKSRDLNEKIGLIPIPNEEENLRLIDPIPAELLLETYKLKAADEARLFLAEFQSIPRIFSRYNVKEAKKSVNVPKNRYIDILPYDYNRVQLTTGNGETGCDYINASFIDGFKELKKYIAAQGPKEETLGDFWRMIWEQKSSIIVMVTRCEEGKRPKCMQYWPHADQDVETYEEFQVKLKSEELCPNYIIRHLSLMNKKEKSSEREVTHIQFISWPDHGVPSEAHQLLTLRRRVNAFKNLFSGPIVVHCSAGVGRTGTYISIDAMMESLEAEGRADIFGFVVTLRKQRCLMVQVEGQYTLIHQALLEHTLFGDTEISLAELHSAVTTLKQGSSDTEPTLMEEEFERLANYKNWRTTNTGMTEENKKKNRSMAAIPYDYNRVVVMQNEGVISNKEHDDEDDDDSSVEEEEDQHLGRYINASYINGYWGPRSFITAQTPLPETTADFWLMVYQNNASMVIMFSDTAEDGKDSDFVYWDTDNKAYGDIEVEMTSTKTYPTFISRNALLRHIKRKESRPVKHVQFLNWKSSELPESPQVLMDFLKEVRSSSGDSKSLSTSPIVVHCNDGSSHSGIFCALWNLLDCAETEKVVDVFQVSKTLCKERQGLISSLNQYQFLYDALETLYPLQNGSVKAELESDLVQIVDETKAAEQPQSVTVDSEEAKKEVKEGSETESSSPTEPNPFEEAGNSATVIVEL